MRLIDDFEKIVCAVLLLGMTALGFANIVVRYGTSHSFAATEELLTGGFVLLTVFGAAIAARRGEHLAVELISDLLPPPARRVVIWLAGALSVALLVASVWFTIGLVQNQIRTGMTSYALNLPLWWYSAAVPLGFALVLVRYVQALVRGPERDG
ncbi:TRAP transporter small permease [Paracoccus zhejiangensis]|uniref:TRAP transporter small permease protein n=1 Tax=Paracoccus zhejiangensis TaxID=1077935 RepID=A0A2H5F061_9RHOB|nr:TRAP transporter small permease [Paracoccus zhejiangensis]AUH64923.1 TRAP transporter small permease [Paracoccus zhejiangensis]